MAENGHEKRLSDPQERHGRGMFRNMDSAQARGSLCSIVYISL